MGKVCVTLRRVDGPKRQNPAELTRFENGGLGDRLSGPSSTIHPHPKMTDKPSAQKVSRIVNFF